jgi:glycosyltransferase involved in cell wall biosynthesis
MRILQVCDHYPPDAGGLATHVRRLARQLAARGHQVKVVAVGDADEAIEEPGIEAERIRSSFSRLPGVYEPGSPPFHPPWPDRGFGRRLEAAAEAFRPDVVHAHGWCAFSVAARSGGWGRSAVCTLHDYGLACPKKSLLRFDAECGPGRGRACLRCDDLALPKRVGLAAALERTVPWLGRRMRLMIAVSGHVSRRVAQAGVDPAALRVVPNFIDVTKNGPDEPDERGDRGERSILYVGPAGPHKGRQVLLEAFRSLRRRGVTLELAGGDGSFAAQAVRDLGQRPESDLAALYRDALMVVVPSVWPDPCPTVALEAMAWGRPVIASATGGLPEILEDRVSGLLVEPKDSAALLRAITLLLDDSELRARLGRGARQAVGRFSAEAVLPELECIYAEASNLGAAG